MSCILSILWRAVSKGVNRPELYYPLKLPKLRRLKVENQTKHSGYTILAISKGSWKAVYKRARRPELYSPLALPQVWSVCGKTLDVCCGYQNRFLFFEDWYARGRVKSKLMYSHLRLRHLLPHFSASDPFEDFLKERGYQRPSCKYQTRKLGSEASSNHIYQGCKVSAFPLKSVFLLYLTHFQCFLFNKK